MALLLLATVSPAHADFSLPEYNAIYMVEKLNTVIGKATYHLKHTDKGVHFSQVTELVGIAALFRDDRIEEDSWLAYDGDLLLLQKYQYLHHGSRKNKNVALQISWATDETSHTKLGKVTGTSRGKVINESVNANVRDTLSFQISLMRDALTESESTDFDDSDSGIFDYPILSKGVLKQYRFTEVGTEELEISNKTISTIKLERKHNNRTTWLWLAPELHYITVKIKRIEEGKSDTLITLDKVNFSPS